jgi:putative flippase GtrA
VHPAVAEQLRHADHDMSLRSRLAELRRYLSVGVVCAALHNLVVISAAWLGLHYLLALLLWAIIVTPTGYALHTSYTFGASFSWSRFMRFASGILSGALLSLVVMFVLCTLFHVAVLIATPVATVIVFAWNYACARWAVRLVPKPGGQDGGEPARSSTRQTA